VKNFWASAELERRFGAVGVDVTFRETPTYFLYAAGERRFRVRQHDFRA
jgi:hypothetical protein